MLLFLYILIKFITYKNKIIIKLYNLKKYLSFFLFYK